MPVIYLDHGASTPVDDRVLKEMLPWFSESYANPHSLEHAQGWEANDAVERARTQIARLIGADSDEVVFTSGATEANNIALLGIARALKAQRNKILISSIEHAAVLEPATALQREGFEVEYVPVCRDGRVDVAALREQVSDRVGLVSIISVNNEIGTIQDIKSIADACHEVGALFHTDSAQALTAINIHVAALDIDFMSISAHKIYGPKGVGALFMRAGLPRPEPILFGGGQERGLRPGTLPVALCVGFGMACSLLAQDASSERDRIVRLRDKLHQALRVRIPELSLNGSPIHRHPGNLNINFRNIEGRTLVQKLQPTIACSTGSACHSGTEAPSHVLRALGLTIEEARSSVRFGLGRFSTEAEVALAADRISDEIESLKQNSPP